MSAGWLGVWDVPEWLRDISAQGDPQEKMAATVNFEIFRADLNEALAARDLKRGGGPAFDPVLEFRMLVLQSSCDVGQRLFESGRASSASILANRVLHRA